MTPTTTEVPTKPIHEPIHKPTHYQIHESFVCFRYTAGEGAYLGGLRDTILPSLTTDLNSRSLAPKSVSVLPSGDRILFCVGYETDAAYPVKFSIELVGSENAALPEVADALESAAEQNDVLCHSLFQIPNTDTGLVYALLMMRG